MSKPAFIYPGQASQYVGMGKDLYEQNALAKSMYEQANEILGFELTRMSFDGPEAELKQTRITQPAIFVHSVIVSKLLQTQPHFVAGHSLGEYSALVAAEVLTFVDALRIVKRRGELMQTAGDKNPGSMAAVVGLSAVDLEAVCREAEQAGIVRIANLNSPQQIVISGSVAGVERAVQLARERGAKRAILLEVSGAFHSPLMEDAQSGLREELDNVHFKKARIPIYTNVTAKPVVEPDALKDLLCRQLTHPVRWTEVVQNMIAAGASRFYEVGPGAVLSGLLKRIDGSVNCSAIGTLDQILELNSQGEGI